MTASRRIFLTGMPASGKTTLGQAVARLRPGWILVDVDSEIEARRGLTVPQIFAADGEAAFRALENEVIFYIEIESETDLSRLAEIADSCACEDGVWRFTLRVGKAGEAA